MAPRALTEQEKMAQKQRVLAKGREIVLQYGIKKTNVDDIAKAAGIAKGSFYNYFADKESFLMALIRQFHMDVFQAAESMIKNSTPENLRRNIELLIRSFFEEPEQMFFMENHKELDLLMEAFDSEQAISFKEMERKMFTDVVVLAGFDPKVVKPEVVHNIIHAIYFMRGSELMIQDMMEETFEVQLKGLLNYIFGEIK